MSEQEPIVERYRQNVGKEPAKLPEDHPDRWQWEYRGTKAERDALREELGFIDEEGDVPVVIDGQEELFA